MAMFQNLVIFYFSLAVLFLAFGVDTPFTEIVAGTTDLYDSSTGVFFGVIPGGLAVAGVVTAIAGISLLAGAAAVPVILGLFIGIVVLPLFTFPLGIINSGGMPDEFRFFLTALFTVLQLLFVISVISYAKGSGE